MSSEYDLVVVYAGTAIEAGLVKGLLEDQGIPVFLQDEFMGSIAPWYAAPSGAGAVKVAVPQRHLEEARVAIRHYQGGDSNA